jgi:hypothetical protein
LLIAYRTWVLANAVPHSKSGSRTKTLVKGRVFQLPRP